MEIPAGAETVSPGGRGLASSGGGDSHSGRGGLPASGKKLKNVPDFEREGDRERYILKYKKRKYEIVKFFRSEWYGVLCDIDPNRILRELGVRA